MSETNFERSWLSKLSSCVDRVAGEEIKKKVLQGSQRLSSVSSRDEIIGWTKEAMDRLDALLNEEKRIRIMTGCACRYPQSELQDLKGMYDKTRNVNLIHKMLQDKFVSFLRNSLRLNDRLVQDVISRGWGLAGVKKGNTIVATKIPKSGNLVEYIGEKDLDKRRSLYCHCPRIRHAIGSKTQISSTYCYCGAGFYKGIWEYVLQQPVRVELVESVLKGDDVCRVTIHLPSN